MRRTAATATASPAPRGDQTGRPLALVTGASSGIGDALARCFASAGYDLILVARSADKLKLLATELAREHGVEARVQPADLAQPGAAGALARAVARRRRPVDVLVNNAGVLSQGSFVKMTPATHQQMIDLNITGLTAMLTAFLPAMVERGSGRVLNVASIASFQPVPSLATYAATKAYVLSLTESVAEELRGTGVTVTALCPGVTATNMLSNAQQANDKVGKIPDFLVGDAHDVARQGMEACLRGEVIRVPGLLNRGGVLASRGAPRWLVRRMSGLLGRSAL